MLNKILPSIATTKGSDWEEKIKEINKLGLKEIALLPTFLGKKERRKLYRLLEESSVASIPLVHIRNDIDANELDYLIERYKTQVFNTHMQIEFPFNKEWSKYSKKIMIENVFHPFDEDELKRRGGICLDISHLENDRLLHKEIFEHNIKILEKYPIVCNHISAVNEEITHIDEKGGLRYDRHQLWDISELDYLKNYPKNYFSSIIAIELENNIEDQLRAKDYILNLLSNK